MPSHHHHHHKNHSSSRSPSSSKHKHSSGHKHHHHKRRDSSSDSMGITTQGLAEIISQNTQVSSIITDIKKPEQESLLDQEVSEDVFLKMMGIKGFESTKNKEHESIEHSTKQAAPKRKFRQRIFKKLGVNRALEPIAPKESSQ